MATPQAAAEDPWWQLSPEEKKRMVQDAWAAALMDDLDMRDDDEDDAAAAAASAAAAAYGVPASKKAMVDLHTPTCWGETTMGEDHDHAGNCAVCLEVLEIKQELRMMPCRHTFHQLCIIKWLFVNRLCPICQFALPTEQEQSILDQEEEDAASHQAMIVD